MSAEAVRFERNLGFLSEQEQQRIENSTVAIAGAGGDGGMLAVQLARLGIGEVRLADPEPFEVENTNRQAICTERTVGTNKAVAVAEYLGDINPSIKTTVYTDGITPENTAEFVADADLVIDETEFTMHALGVMLARESRKREIPVLTALNIGFGALVTTFKPDGKSLERVLGFKESDDIEYVASQEVPLSRWLPYLPPYADIKTFEKVASGEKSAPSIAPGVAIAAGMGSTQALLNLLEGSNNRPKPIYAPRAYVFDSMTMEAKRTKFTKTNHYKSLSMLGLKNLLKQTPQASY